MAGIFLLMIKDNVYRVPIDELKPNPWNPNEQSEWMFKKAMDSIAEHGFLDPVLVRRLPDGALEIVDGEHRWRAASQLGFTEIPVNDLGEIPDDVAKQLTIITNETRGKNNPDKLKSLLEDLRTTKSMEALTRSLPLGKKQINALISGMKRDPFASGSSQRQDAEEGEEQKSSSAELAPIQLSEAGPSSAPRPFIDYNEPFKTVNLKLPEGVASQLKNQIERWNKALFPEEDPKNCSPVMAIEAMVQHLSQIPEEQLP